MNIRTVQDFNQWAAAWRNESPARRAWNLQFVIEGQRRIAGLSAAFPEAQRQAREVVEAAQALLAGEWAVADLRPLKMDEIGCAALAAGLAVYPVPVDAAERRYRKADPAEFMLMDFADGFYRFKHRATRNYLYVREGGAVAIPKDAADPFFGGFYGPAADLGSVAVGA
jgi:hypothetical protein